MRRMAWLLAVTATVLGSLGAAQLQAHAQAHRRRSARTRASASAPAASPAATKSESTGAEGVVPDAPASDASAPAAEPKPADSQPEPAARPSTENKKSGAEAKPAAQVAADGAALQQELAELMDDLVQTRERVTVIGNALFKTRVRIKLENRADEQVAGRVSLRLDGAPIFSAEGSTLRDAERPLFEGFAAPGPHVLELEIELRARRDESYRYNQRQSFRFEVVRDRRTDLRLVLDDDSDIADDFADDREGEYDVRTRLQVRAVPLNEE